MKISETDLIATHIVRVRFSEIDALRMVWHGNYVAYLEDAREKWGQQYGFAYMDMYNNGFVAPLYDLQLHYRGMATMDDELCVQITYCQTVGAKLVFHYTITNLRTKQVILTAESVQLFLTKEGEFSPAIPPFFEEWQKQHNLI